jgi:tetratricopeptide (TPR) repeat protein
MNPTLNRRERAQASCAAGDALFAKNSFAEAQVEYEQAVALYPSMAPAHLGLSKSLRNLGNWAGAEKHARAALDADPGYAAAAHYLGALLVEQDKLANALPFLEAAAKWAPDVAQHHRDLGVTQLFLGDVAGSRETLLTTMRLDVHSHEVLYTLIRMWQMNDGSADADRLLEIVQELADRAGELPTAEQAQVLFSLAKAHDDRGEVDKAVKAFDRANAVKRATLTYDVVSLEARYRRIAEVFSKELIGGLATSGAPSNRPIFIVGMPRSGSTLIEQILSSHPEVHGAGEIYNLPQLVEAARGPAGGVYPEWGATMNAIDCAAIGEAYVKSLPPGLPGQTRTTDKWLENFEQLGLIGVCLPNAKIIHCRRDPRDQLFSCWSLLFSQNQEYAYTFEELGRFYRAYAGLMEHWRQALPEGRMLELNYEELIADPETSAKRVLDHCGLEWDDQVLKFWEARRPVKSASMFQVREPIYDRSIGRWKPYADYLAPLFKALDL